MHGSIPLGRFLILVMGAAASSVLIFPQIATPSLSQSPELWTAQASAAVSADHPNFRKEVVAEAKRAKNRSWAIKEAKMVLPAQSWHPSHATIYLASLNP